MAHTHLTEQDRYDIYEWKAKGQTITKIACKIGRNKSTVSRELSRNTGLRGYRPQQAQLLADSRHQGRRGGKRVEPLGIGRCFELVKQGYSPAQAAGRTQREGLASLSHETLYQYIYADKQRDGTLWRHLRCQKKRRKRYASGRQLRGQIVGRIGIERRSKRVDARATVGHWEADTVIGRNRRFCLVTLVERKIGYSFLRRVDTRNAEEVAACMISALRECKALARTITFDNGR